MEKIFNSIYDNSKAQIEVNLPDQTITILSTGEQEYFDINSYKKDNMLNGFDDIDYLQNIKAEIEDFANGLLL